MARPRSITPRLWYHTASGRWCCTVHGQRQYLGRDRSTAEQRYRELLTRLLLGEPDTPQDSPNPITTRSVNEVLLVYREHASRHVSSSQLHRIDQAIDAAQHLFGVEPAERFDQLSLQSIRTWLCSRPSTRNKKQTLSRNYVNSLVGCLQTAWTWLAGQRIVPAENAMALRMVRSLRRGQGGQEVSRVLPIAGDVVAATLPHLHEPIRTMVQLQALTGMRPGEVCVMRRCDISTEPGERLEIPDGGTVWAVEVEGVRIWLYGPHRHKTQHRGKPRIIPLGPKAQLLLRPWFDRPRDSYLFSPKEASDRWRRERGQAARYGRGRQPGKVYTAQVYGEAVERGAARAGVQHWQPNQLRHTVASQAVELSDYDTAAALLGHAHPQMTAVYATQAILRAAAHVARVG